MSRMLAALLAILGGFTPATAQTLGDCDSFAANARNLMSPPEVAVQSFANGAIRIMGLDTIEPVCCYAYILITHPEPGEPYDACTLISMRDQLGYAGVDMAALEASYDPARGLIVTVPVGVYDGERSVMAPMTITINQATGEVTAIR